MAKKKAGFCAPIGPNEVVINDATAALHVNPEVNGERKCHGLIPRDFKAHPVGYLACAKPFDLPLIPESEWEARLRKQAEDKAQLSNVRNVSGPEGRPIPSRDQNGRGYCHDAATEVLTERGWVAWPDYNWSDLLGTVNTATGFLEFQAPFERHVYDYDGELVHSTNRRLDFGVTPDHRMLVRKWDEARRTLSDAYTFQRAGEIGWYAGLMRAPRGFIGTELVEVEVPGDRRYDGDDFLALLGLIISDGYAGGADGERPGKGTRNLVSFASFRAESRPAIAALAARLGFREAPSRPGVWNRWDAGALAAWVRANCYTGAGLGSRNKRVPELVKVASARQIKHFLHYFDDRDRAGTQFYSTSKRLIDDLQELHLRVGKRGTISMTGPKESECAGKRIYSRGGYVLHVGAADRLCLDRKKHVERDRYKGPVYCAAVPNGTLVTRRKGSVLISGNCWAHSGTSAALLVRAVNGQPYSDLSAYAVACIIKGYRDEGGWGSEGVEFIAERGIPDGKHWPQQSTARANDNPETWDNAKLHRFTEWMDLDPRQMKAQLVTCLLLGIPVVSDFNWWSHSVCTIDLVSVSPFRTRIWNSWSDSWSENGTGILEGNKAIPDAALGCRVMTVAP